jgi:hypothetical protein
MFVSAVAEFGKIDAIGHSMIIVILIGILTDDRPNAKHQPLLAPLSYGGALVIYLAAYYGLHAVIYGTTL